MREVNDASVNPEPPARRERRKQGRGQKGRCGERERDRHSVSHLRSPHLLVACVRACRDYEAASEIENVPTARTLRHTPTKRRKTALPDSDFMNVWGGNTEGRRRILGLNVRVRERTHFFEVKIQIKLP